MQHRPLRAPLCSLLSALVLVACGGTDVVPAEEALGTQESALCSGVSVSTSISGASIYQGELAASGSWTSSTGANAVRLEYYVNNTLYTSEERTGSSGTWYFSYTGFTACGTTYAFQVKAYPMVIDSNGNRSTCWASPNTVSQNVSTAACPGGVWTLTGAENCYDLIMASCYTRSWTPSCPSSPAGKPCSNVGDYCWQVASASTLREYTCM
ncbi:MAG TPA: hypothetical protein VFZ09_20405 [Archangium sp.]|uniref:hypothetical protein n=1 Tax=Archangium sp. TaxID=1872627 RepID=UPI002E2FF831|nr:hypothetical protein [Archangium sp.]HEX5748614.1 hypothetical protein [Archangium sp.]